MKHSCKLPDISCHHVACFLEEHYDIVGKIALLNGERDKNFRITLSDEAQNKSYVFKVAGIHEQRGMLECQEQVFEKIGSITSIASMQAIPSRRGCTIETIRCEDGALPSMPPDQLA